MNLKEIGVSDTASEDIVQFVKHLEENLDPNDEFDCDVSITTVTRGEVDEIPADGLADNNYHDEYPDEQEGVYIHIEFEENKECPSGTVSELTESFFTVDEYTRNSEFDGASGEYDCYVFHTK